jgi:hypothetical protein
MDFNSGRMTVVEQQAYPQYAAQYLEHEKHPYGRVCQRQLPLLGQSRKPLNAKAVVVREAIPGPMAENTRQQRQEMRKRTFYSLADEWRRGSYPEAANQYSRHDFRAELPQLPLPGQTKKRANQQLQPKRLYSDGMGPQTQVKLYVRSNAARYQGNTGKFPGKALQINYGSRMRGCERHGSNEPASYKEGKASTDNSADHLLNWIRVCLGNNTGVFADVGVAKTSVLSKFVRMGCKKFSKEFGGRSRLFIQVLFLMLAFALNSDLQAQSDEACQAAGFEAVPFMNGSFEFPVVKGNTMQPARLLRGWKTNDRASFVEIWNNQTSPDVKAVDGTQFIELNAAGPGALWFDVISSGSRCIQWSFWHKARVASLPDRVDVWLGADTGKKTYAGRFVAEGNEWKQHSGIYVVPAGQWITRFYVASVPEPDRDPSVGNFIDAVVLERSGSSDVSDSSGLLFSPNPAGRDIRFLRLPSENTCTARIYNRNQELKLTLNRLQTKQPYSLAGLPVGTYYLHLHDASGQVFQVAQLIKQDE